MLSAAVTHAPQEPGTAERMGDDHCRHSRSAELTAAALTDPIKLPDSTSAQTFVNQRRTQTSPLGRVKLSNRI